MSRMLDSAALRGYGQRILVTARNEYMFWNKLRSDGVVIAALEPRVEEFVRIALDLVGFPRSHEKEYDNWVGRLVRAIHEGATESDLGNELATCRNMAVHVQFVAGASLDIVDYH